MDDKIRHESDTDGVEQSQSTTQLFLGDSGSYDKDIADGTIAPDAEQNGTVESTEGEEKVSQGDLDIEERKRIAARRARRGAAEAVKIALFVALLTVGCRISIPMVPVPFTLQTLFTCMAGCFLSPLSAFLSQVIYVLMGLIGIPVFTAGGGFAYVLQPTFGFLLFMPALAWSVSVLIRQSKRISNKPLRIAYEHTVCIVLGFIHLVLGTLYYLALAKWYLHSNITVSKAFYSCCVIFLPSAAIKAIVSAALYEALGKRLKIRSPYTQKQPQEDEAAQ
ncbi:MAG: biotin transporter BioY [Clostridia bacterium]|nr:biotin transporter BioY [Clostridia bacterium]